MPEPSMHYDDLVGKTVRVIGQSGKVYDGRVRAAESGTYRNHLKVILDSTYSTVSVYFRYIEAVCLIPEE